MNPVPNKRRNETHKKQLNDFKWTVESYIMQEIHNRAQSYEIECGGHFIFRKDGIFIVYTFYDDLGDKCSFNALKALKRDMVLYPNEVRFPFHTHVRKNLNDPVKQFYSRMISAYPSHWDIGWAGVHEQHIFVIFTNGELYEIRMPKSSGLTQKKVSKALHDMSYNSETNKAIVHNYEMDRITEQEALSALKESERKYIDILNQFGVIRKKHSIFKPLRIEIEEF